jgi:ferric-dicitrate binding protein FerR (iron transport regulator)
MKNIDNIVNLVAGNINPKDKEKVLSEIHNDTESRKVFFKIKAAWAVLSSTKKQQDYETERTYLVLQEKIHRKTFPFHSTIGTFIKYAAILVILIGFPILFYLNKQNSSPEISKEFKYTSVVADNGQISKIILPDSSLVWLNSGTTLSYNSGYAVTNRDLNLNGQAYMHIKRDDLNPLMVACNDLKVKVLGTKFDVSAYPGDDKIKVVLESGSVQLLHTGDDAFNYRLKPGEMAQYDIKLNEVAIKKVNAADFTSWKEGYLIFDDVPMEDVIARLERKFDVEIIVKHEEVYKSIFNANFKDENLTEILEYIKYSCPIKYKTVKADSEAKSKIEFYYQSK